MFCPVDVSRAGFALTWIDLPAYAALHRFVLFFPAVLMYRGAGFSSFHYNIAAHRRFSSGLRADVPPPPPTFSSLAVLTGRKFGGIK